MKKGKGGGEGRGRGRNTERWGSRREGEEKEKKESQFNMRSPERFLEELSKICSYRIDIADKEDFSEKRSFTHSHARMLYCRVTVKNASGPCVQDLHTFLLGSQESNQSGGKSLWGNSSP